MFNIPVMGDRTGSVESLPSYLQRCAKHHSVPTCQFIDYLLSRYSDKKCRSAGSITKSSLLRACPNTIKVMEAVRSHTGVNLIPTTFSLVQKVGTDPRREIYHKVRWCPECFQDMLSLDQEPYIKLIWFFRDLHFCPTHKLQLLERCPNYSRTQSSIWNSSAINFCFNCGMNLSSRLARDGANWAREKYILKSWESEGADLIKLLIDLMNHQEFRCDRKDRNFGNLSIDNIIEEKSRLTSEGIKKSILDFSSMFHLPHFINAYQNIWPDRAVRKQIWGEKPISLRTLRLLAYHSGVDIIDIVTGHLNTVASTASNHINKDIPRELTAIKKRKKNPHKKNREKILSFVSRSDPISLKEVARQTGLSLGYINYQFPTLKEKIVTRYASHVEQVKLKKHNDAKIAALEYFFSNELRGKPKSRKQALIFLLQETGLTKLYLKPAIEAAYNLYSEG